MSKRSLFIFSSFVMLVTYLPVECAYENSENRRMETRLGWKNCSENPPFEFSSVCCTNSKRNEGFFRITFRIDSGLLLQLSENAQKTFEEYAKDQTIHWKHKEFNGEEIQLKAPGKKTKDDILKKLCPQKPILEESSVTLDKKTLRKLQKNAFILYCGCQLSNDTIPSEQSIADFFGLQQEENARFVSSISNLAINTQLPRDVIYLFHQLCRLPSVLPIFKAINNFIQEKNCSVVTEDIHFQYENTGIDASYVRTEEFKKNKWAAIKSKKKLLIALGVTEDEAQLIKDFRSDKNTVIILAESKPVYAQSKDTLILGDIEKNFEKIREAVSSDQKQAPL